MNTYKLHGRSYQVELLDSDIVFFDTATMPKMDADLVIYGGAELLREEAIFHCTYGDSEEGIEYDSSDVRHYMTENLIEFVSRNISRATKPDDEQIEQEALFV